MATAIKRVDPGENEQLASLEARAKQPSAFYRVMANRPEVLRNFPPLYSATVGPGSVDRRLKEALYLATSYANHCAFCTAAHEAGAGKAGLTADDLAALREECDAGFSEAERAAIAYARELTRTATATQTRDALRPHFSDEQIVEMTLTIAMANFTNRFNSGLEIEP
jgi:uncharacterized peroxidase-related enzyme